MEKKQVDEEWANHLSRVHWQVFMRASFVRRVGEESARGAAIAFIKELGDPAYAAAFWGAGRVGERMHVHFLLGGVWKGRKPESGIDHVALALRHVKRTWKHGQSHVAVFDPKQRGCLYLADHHDFEFVGQLQTHRPRGSRGGRHKHQSEGGAHERTA
jgi:hypothetical protein